jgi:hypothetical protein
MSGGDRDRLEEKLRDKEQADEDRYFRERDRQLLDKMKSARPAAPEEHEADPARGERTVTPPRRSSWLARCFGRITRGRS